MRSVSVRLEDLQKVTIPIGFVGENLHTKVLIDCKKVLDEYPTAVVSLTVKPPEGDAYPAITTREGDIVEWTVTNSDLVYDGNGEMQLTFTVGEVIAKSFVGKIRVVRSIVGNGEVPTPVEEWLIQANETLEAVEVALVEIPEAIAQGFAEIIDDTAGEGDTGKVWSADKLTSEFATKANKPVSSTNGNLAALDANGNLTDSGSKASDFAVIDDTATAGTTDKTYSADKLAKKFDDIDIADNSFPYSVEAITGNRIGVWKRGYYETPSSGNSSDYNYSVTSNYITTLIPVTPGEQYAIYAYGVTGYQRQYEIGRAHV